MEESQKILVTSKFGLYIWRSYYSLIVIFLILFLSFLIVAFISDIFTTSNKIYVNPILSCGTEMGARIATILLSVQLVLLLNWIVRLLWRSRHFSINDAGIHFNNEIVEWNKISKITAYGCNGPIIVLKLKNHYRLKKIVGVLPVFSARNRVNKISSFAQAQGIKLRRWLI